MCDVDSLFWERGGGKKTKHLSTDVSISHGKTLNIQVSPSFFVIIWLSVDSCWCTHAGCIMPACVHHVLFAAVAMFNWSLGAMLSTCWALKKEKKTHMRTGSSERSAWRSWYCYCGSVWEKAGNGLMPGLSEKGQRDEELAPRLWAHIRHS